ncbi:uncharacterized protein IL334_003682 [Kwoniella shivajii]|uniref:Uncharacterized protein n=1 Tax=Kwoniella shivajii TaxID=564305 RepID=A0ABZ1CZG5_9TREE|nr:hypothetical protein IL334_003682 [Kwoniella shivajii]
MGYIVDSESEDTVSQTNDAQNSKQTADIVSALTTKYPNSASQEILKLHRDGHNLRDPSALLESSDFRNAIKKRLNSIDHKAISKAYFDEKRNDADCILPLLGGYNFDVNKVLFVNAGVRLSESKPRSVICFETPDSEFVSYQRSILAWAEQLRSPFASGTNVEYHKNYRGKSFIDTRSAADVVDRALQLSIVGLCKWLTGTEEGQMKSWTLGEIRPFVDDEAVIAGAQSHMNAWCDHPVKRTTLSKTSDTKTSDTKTSDTKTSDTKTSVTKTSVTKTSKPKRLDPLSCGPEDVYVAWYGLDRDDSGLRTKLQDTLDGLSEPREAPIPPGTGFWGEELNWNGTGYDEIVKESNADKE